MTRKASESIKIGDNIKVTVLSVNGNQIRIGIDAPKSVPVMRTELAGKFDRHGNKVAGGNQ